MKYIVDRKDLRILVEGVRDVGSMSIDEHINEFCKDLKDRKCQAFKLSKCEVVYEDENNTPIIMFYEDFNDKLREHIGKKFYLYLKEIR